MKREIQIAIVLGMVMFAVALFFISKVADKEEPVRDKIMTDMQNDNDDMETQPSILSMKNLRNRSYKSSINIVETLPSGINYERYIASYNSDGNTIFGLLAVPFSEDPAQTFPAIIFNHGYIAPEEYVTTERYVAYLDTFARNGYIVFKSDYRGHGKSEGEARGGYGNQDYTIDVLHALAAVQSYVKTDPERIGMWGHSMGGHITLESMVVSKEIKAGVIWAGVVGSYPELLEYWKPWWVRNNQPSPTRSLDRVNWREFLTEEYGSPTENPSFWKEISAAEQTDKISGPIQIHHGTADSSVPVILSVLLAEKLEKNDKPHELYIYEGDDHNISQNFNVAAQRSLEYFDRYLKVE